MLTKSVEKHPKVYLLLNACLWLIFGVVKVTCSECHGNGSLSPQELGFAPYDVTEDDLRCSDCDGKGVIN
jgi:hypothetical protein